MPHTYSWQHTIHNYEGDAWGQLRPSGILRLLERSATVAAADAGYGDEFHARHGTAWVIRRMTMLLPSVAHSGDDLEITTWPSHFVRVRGGREYRVHNLVTDRQIAGAIAEWVYIDRGTGAPRAIPRDLAVDFDVPGAPLGNYNSPPVAPPGIPRGFVDTRRAEWYEADAMGHINNAIYADWLDAAVRSAMEEMGWPVARFKSEGYQLKAEYLFLDYKRPAMPGERLLIVTRLVGMEGRLCAVSQSIMRAEDSAQVVAAEYVYGWADDTGAPSDAPPGWFGLSQT